MNIMRKAIKIIGVFCLSVTGFSCRHTYSSPKEYMSYIGSLESLHKKINVGNVDYTFRIVPPEVVALWAAKDENGGIDRSKYSARLKELQGNLFVNIDMQLSDGSGPVMKYKLKDNSEYEQRVMYYEFNVKDDIKIRCNGTEMPPSSCQYENHLGLMPKNTIVLAFPDCRQGKDIQIVFNDRALGNLFIKANFNNEDIQNTDQLKF